MPYCVIKPVLWNTAAYKRPSGVRATSGYPKTFGYGVEEWNNADDGLYDMQGASWRAFHTEPLRGFAAERHVDDVLLFMIASDGGRQYLVGVAGRATWIERSEGGPLARRLGWDRRKDDAWRLAGVRQRFAGKVDRFRSHWKSELASLPSWRCPADMFLWLKSPVRVDAKRISGKSKFITMYTGHQLVSSDQALELLDRIQAAGTAKTVARLRSFVGAVDPSLEDDLAELGTDRRLDATTRARLIEARLGQGRFRAQLLRAWSSSCAVTGCRTERLLRASHVKPWRDCTNAERLDPSNGLLLAAHIDALFDAGLVTFDRSGRMLVSKQVQAGDRRHLRLKGSLRGPLNRALCEFLRYHREEIYADGD